MYKSVKVGPHSRDTAQRDAAEQLRMPHRLACYCILIVPKLYFNNNRGRGRRKTYYSNPNYPFCFENQIDDIDSSKSE